MRKAKKFDKVIIICTRKEDHDNPLDEVMTEGKCNQCGETVVCGNLVLEQMRREQPGKEASFWCGECFNKTPKMGKLARPSPEMIKRMREEGADFDEVKLREVLHRIKHKGV